MNINNEHDINQTSSKIDLFKFSNELNLNISSLTIFSVSYDSFLQISPDNNYLAFMKNNNSLEIFKKENNNWVKDKQIKITSLGKKKAKGINWSYDNTMILIYATDNENNSIIKAINKSGPDWICEIEIKGNISHSSFYPDSKSIVYIKSLINTLNILSLLKHNNLSRKNHKTKKDKLKNEYLFLKFDDIRSINYIKHNNNLFMILPCYGRTSCDISKRYITIPPSDYIVILKNKKVLKCFPSKTNDLDRIIPINNKFSFFIAVEKEFYKYPFYIYNLIGEIMFKSEFPSSRPKLVTNPCLLYNKNFESKFILVQEPNGKFRIMGCDIILKLSNIYYYYDYNKLYDNTDKTAKIKIFNNYNSNYNYNYNILTENSYITINDNIFDKNNILFLEEKKSNNNKNEENIINETLNELNFNIFNKKNKNNIELIKVNPFNVDICYEENDYLLHAEISPIKNYICFINEKYPKFLFFGNYLQSGVFKIIKFRKNILSFKWSTVQDLLLVTLDSSIFYLITKDNYISYDLENNYNLNNIFWSSSGKEVILSNEDNKIRIMAVLY